MIKTVKCIAHKRLKDVVTRSVLTTEKASKCVCDRSSALDPLDELTALPPDSLAGYGKGKGLRKGQEERG